MYRPRKSVWFFIWQDYHANHELGFSRKIAMSGVFFLKLFAALINFFIYLFISTYFAAAGYVFIYFVYLWLSLYLLNLPFLFISFSSPRWHCFHWCFCKWHILTFFLPTVIICTQDYVLSLSWYLIWQANILNGYFVDLCVDSSLAGLSLQCVPLLDSASADLLCSARCGLLRFTWFNELSHFFRFYSHALLLLRRTACASSASQWHVRQCLERRLFQVSSGARWPQWSAWPCCSRKWS